MPTVIPVFPAEIKNGALVVKTPQKFREYARTLSGPLDLVVKKHRRSRTNNQNAYYWGAFIPLLAEHYGYTDDEMHEALKIKFLLKMHGRFPTTRSTASLNSAEFTEYLEKIHDLAAEDGIRIPTPDEYYSQ